MAATPSSSSQTLNTSHNGCKWSKNNDAVIINNIKQAYVYPIPASGTIPANFKSRAASASNLAYKDLAVKPDTTTPIKIVMAGGNNNQKGA